MTEDRCRQAVL